MGIAALHNIEEIATKFKSLLDYCCEKACSLFARDMGMMIRDLASVDLNITNKQLQDYENRDPFLPAYYPILTLSLISQLKQAIRQWKQQLVDLCCDQFIKEFIKKLCDLLMGEIRKKKLTQAGGQYVEKVTNHLVNFFQNITAMPVRKQFMQLVHMSSVLCADTVEEVKDYIETARTTLEFSFSIAQVKDLLLLRTDIPTDQLGKLTETSST